MADPLTPAEVLAERVVWASASPSMILDALADAGYRVVSVAEVDRLRAVAEWAMNADHHAGCSGWDLHYRCKCGRRDLFRDRFTEEVDRV